MVAIGSVTDVPVMSVSRKRAIKSTLRKADVIEIEATLILLIPAQVIVSDREINAGEKRAKNSTKRSIIGSIALVSIAAEEDQTAETARRGPIQRADTRVAVIVVIINMIGVRAFLVMLINS